MKKLLCAALCIVMLTSPVYAINTLTDDDIDISAPSAILMEKVTGEVIYEKNSHERLPPASVTKVMTMLLIVEAVERSDISLEDTVIASERAASFGGSCVFLEEGEKMSVHEMLKCICVVSANDCAVAMAEHLCGSEQAFVARMNDRARELGLKDTNFKNCTGLFEDDEHYTSAYDIAVMSRELIRHDMIKDYTTIWMDTIRGGEFGLSNTNKLVYYYDGCTGLKTGFTQEAGYCISATAERDGMELIAVIMKGTTSDSRNTDAKTLLNYGFSTYTLADIQPEEPLPVLPVTLGTADTVALTLPEEGRTLLLEKSRSGGLTQTVELPETVTAPIQAGQQVGTLTVRQDDTALLTVPIVAADTVEKLSWSQMTRHMLQMAIFCG